MEVPSLDEHLYLAIHTNNSVSHGQQGGGDPGNGGYHPRPRVSTERIPAEVVPPHRYVSLNRDGVGVVPGLKIPRRHMRSSCLMASLGSSAAGACGAVQFPVLRRYRGLRRREEEEGVEEEGVEEEERLVQGQHRLGTGSRRAARRVDHPREIG